MDLDSLPDQLPEPQPLAGQVPVVAQGGAAVALEALSEPDEEDGLDA